MADLHRQFLDSPPLSADFYNFYVVFGKIWPINTLVPPPVGKPGSATGSIVIYDKYCLVDAVLNDYKIHKIGAFVAWYKRSILETVSVELKSPSCDVFKFAMKL